MSSASGLSNYFSSYNNAMATHPDVVILGGGVIGLTTAFYLTQAGARVAVFDKGEFGQESSWAGAGILPPGPSLKGRRSGPELLAAHSARLHPQLARELRDSTGVDTGFLLCGGLVVTDDATPERIWREQEIVFERLDAEAIARLEPNLRPPAGLIFSLPAMGQLRNPRHVRALLAWCVRQGVSLTPGCPAAGFVRDGQRIRAVRTAQGDVAGGEFLIAAGAWSGGMMSELGFQPAIRPIRGQIVLLSAATPQLQRVVEVGRRYLVPRPDGRVLVGSTEEDVGFHKVTTSMAARELIDFALGLVPRLGEAAVERCWAGLRPGSADGLPYLGAVPGYDNLFVAAGHYRSGLQLSPGTGMVMKEAILGEPLSVPLDSFRLDRG